MIRIEKPAISDAQKLYELGKATFLQAHSHSAPEKEIAQFLELNYTVAVFEKELIDPINIYHLLYYKDQLVGYSKIILNQPIKSVSEQNITKLERIYFLTESYGLGLAQQLLEYNIAFAKQNGQKGIWLYVWVENRRAIRFYEKEGFKIIDSHDFKISERHSNPNHQMYLNFG